MSDWLKLCGLIWQPRLVRHQMSEMLPTPWSPIYWTQGSNIATHTAETNACKISFYRVMSSNNSADRTRQYGNYLMGKPITYDRKIWEHLGVGKCTWSEIKEDMFLTKLWSIHWLLVLILASKPYKNQTKWTASLISDNDDNVSIKNDC